MGRILTIQEQAERIEQRRKALGRPVLVPANKGGKRTAVKRALLDAIEAEARRQGRSVPFAAAR